MMVLMEAKDRAEAHEVIALRDALLASLRALGSTADGLVTEGAEGVELNGLARALKKMADDAGKRRLLHWGYGACARSLAGAIRALSSRRDGADQKFREEILHATNDLRNAQEGQIAHAERVAAEDQAYAAEEASARAKGPTQKTDLEQFYQIRNEGRWLTRKGQDYVFGRKMQPGSEKFRGGPALDDLLARHPLWKAFKAEEFKNGPTRYRKGR